MSVLTPIPFTTLNSAPATGLLGSQVISPGGTDSKLLLVGSEKVLVCYTKTPNSFSSFALLNTQSDNLSSEIDTGVGGLDIGSLFPLASNRIGYVGQTGTNIYIGAINASGATPVWQATPVTLATAGDAGYSKYETIGNGDDKSIMLASVEPNATTDRIDYWIFDWNGTAFSLDTNGNWTSGTSTLKRTLGLVTTDTANDRGLISWTDSFSDAQISSFTFNGSLANRNDTIITGGAPSGDFADDRRLIEYGTNEAILLIKRSSGNVEAAKVTNLAGSPSVGTFSSTIIGSVFDYGCVKLDDDRFIVYYRPFSPNTDIRYKICDKSGAIPTAGSEQTLASTVNLHDAEYLSDGRVLFSYHQFDASSAIRFYVLEA